MANQDSAEFWQASAKGRFVLQHCSECREYQFYPRLICSHCGSRTLTWAEASGFGQIYSFTVVRRPASPEFTQMTPYVVALIDLQEGPRMMANIVRCPDFSAIKIGVSVKLAFEPQQSGVSLPQFELAPGQALNAER